MSEWFFNCVEKLKSIFIKEDFIVTGLFMIGITYIKRQKKDDFPIVKLSKFLAFLAPVILVNFFSFFGPLTKRVIHFLSHARKNIIYK